MHSEDEYVASYLNLISGLLLPGDGFWPSGDSYDLGNDVIGHLRDSERGAVKDALSLLGPSDKFDNLAETEKIHALSELESNQHAAFSIIRQIIFLAYYAQPETIDLLRSRGHDIDIAPLPRGYKMKPFDNSQIPSNGRGVWIPTEDIRLIGEVKVK